mmetsp:Transcript_31349/g.82168  ORF Transcript_31349/g.82168 Transcript_31349/m.82168 type:complete len:499 (-) Transcript_31349:233-1729(-)
MSFPSGSVRESEAATMRWNLLWLAAPTLPPHTTTFLRGTSTATPCCRPRRTRLIILRAPAKARPSPQPQPTTRWRQWPLSARRTGPTRVHLSRLVLKWHQVTNPLQGTPSSSVRRQTGSALYRDPFYFPSPFVSFFSRLCATVISEPQSCLLYGGTNSPSTCLGVTHCSAAVVRARVLSAHPYPKACCVKSRSRQFQLGCRHGAPLVGTKVTSACGSCVCRMDLTLPREPRAIVQHVAVLVGVTNSTIDQVPHTPRRESKCIDGPKPVIVVRINVSRRAWPSAEIAIWHVAQHLQCRRRSSTLPDQLGGCHPKIALCPRLGHHPGNTASPEAAGRKPPDVPIGAWCGRTPRPEGAIDVGNKGNAGLGCHRNQLLQVTGNHLFRARVVAVKTPRRPTDPVQRGEGSVLRHVRKRQRRCHILQQICPCRTVSDNVVCGSPRACSREFGVAKKESWPYARVGKVPKSFIKAIEWGVAATAGSIGQILLEVDDCGGAGMFAE